MNLKGKSGCVKILQQTLQEMIGNRTRVTLHDNALLFTVIP